MCFLKLLLTLWNNHSACVQLKEHMRPAPWQVAHTRTAVYVLRDIPCRMPYTVPTTTWRRTPFGEMLEAALKAVWLLPSSLWFERGLNPGRGETQLLWAVGFLCFLALQSEVSVQSPLRRQILSPRIHMLSSLTWEQFKSQALCVNGTKRNWLWRCEYVLLN